MQPRNTWTTVLAGLSLMVVGAGTGLAAASAGAATTGETYTVNVDGTNPNAVESFLAYYPGTVKVHPGDTVVFHWQGPGEPHSVTLGTLADAAVQAFASVPPDAEQPPKPALDADGKLPQMLPEGPGDAVQSASNPCYLTTAMPPLDAACPAGSSSKPDFTGTQTYFNSGWLSAEDGDSFTVHLSDTIKPGTYRYMCLLHREHMTGSIEVVPEGTAVPSAEEQTATGQAELKAEEAKLSSAVDDLRHGKHAGMKMPSEHAVVAGSSTKDSEYGSIDEFGPNVISVPVGGTVTWTFDGVHTVSFNTTKANDDPRTEAPDGTIHLNGDALAPAPPPSGPPPAEGAPPVAITTSTFDGSGLHSSGIVFGDPGTPTSYAVTFTKAGKYHYICTIHDGMEGDVIVGAAASSGGNGGQVSEVPSGGAATGGGISTTSSSSGLVGLGIAVMAGGAALVAVPIARRRRGTV
jgi:plastocyanin